MLGDPAEKSRVGTRTNAAAVDMESAIVAEVCAQAGVPFGCLRVISDALEDAIPARLLEVLQGGTVAPARLARALLHQPSLVIHLWRLAWGTRLAARNLSKALLEVVDSAAAGLPPG
jgi:hypothetical protein